MNNRYFDFIFDKSKDNITEIIKTGTPLDYILAGGLTPGLYIVGAEASIGKTAYCLQLAKAISDIGHKAVFFSYEMTSKELVSRILSSQCGQKGYDFAPMDILLMNCRDRMREVDKQALREITRDYLSSAGARNLDIVDMTSGSGINLSDLIQGDWLDQDDKARPPHNVGWIGDIICTRVSDGGYTPGQFAIFVDYLQLLEPSDAVGDKRLDTGQAVKELKDLSLLYNVPIFVISRIRRADYTTVPTTDVFSETQEIEYCADVLIVITLFGDRQAPEDVRLSEKDRERHYRENRALLKAAPVKPCKIYIIKNRNGGTGAYFADFIGRQTRYKWRATVTEDDYLQEAKELISKQRDTLPQYDMNIGDIIRKLVPSDKGIHISKLISEVCEHMQLSEEEAATGVRNYIDRSEDYHAIKSGDIFYIG